MPRLTDDEIRTALASLPGWDRDGDQIVRTIRFPEFMDGIRFIAHIADMAEAADHHPDIDIRYRNVRFALTTHDQGGLTEKDTALASQISQALG